MDKIKCETCGGTGGSRLVSKGEEIVTEYHKCEKCDGTGYVETMETVYSTGEEEVE